jgi:hypothetical protein
MGHSRGNRGVRELMLFYTNFFTVKNPGKAGLGNLALGPENCYHLDAGVFVLATDFHRFSRKM